MPHTATMTTNGVQEIEQGIFQIDHDFQGVAGVIASYLFAGDDGLTLIETGPTSSLDTLLAGIRRAGFGPERITRVLVTHIHLDHAGAAGTLLRRLPDARLFVHPIGAPHLIDPSKLLASATRIYGNAMDRLWGEVAPVPEERVTIVEDNDTIPAGDRTLRALDTPGHASHHHAFHEPEAGLMFTGDIAAVRLAGSRYIRPATPPPELELELWRKSIARLRELRPRRLLLTHFGAFDDPDWHFDHLLSRLFFWGGWMLARLNHGAERDTLVEELTTLGDAEIREIAGSDEFVEPYELATPYGMTVDGYARYFRKRRERVAV